MARRFHSARDDSRRTHKTHTRAHTRTLSHIHSHIQTHTSSLSLIHSPTRTQKNKTPARTRARTHTHTHLLTYIHAHPRARAHTHTHAHTRTRPRTHTHTVCASGRRRRRRKGFFLRESADFMLCRGRPLKPVIAATAQQLENLLELRYENPNVDHAGVRRLGLPGRVCSLTCRNCWRDADAPRLMCARTMPSAGSDAYGSEMRIMSLFVAP